MNLFIVTVTEDYEDNYILGIFDSVEKADNALQQWLAEHDFEGCDGDWTMRKLNCVQ